MDLRSRLLGFDLRAWRAFARIEERPWGRTDVLLAIGTMVVAAALAFYGIDRESLWLDEAITYHRALLPLSELTKDTIAFKHIPTYFVLIHYWVALGDSETMLRMPSALASIAAVGTTYCLGRIAGTRLTGAASALLLAMSPFHIRYAQEARMYALLTLAAAAYMTGALYLFKHPERAAIPLLKKKPEGGLELSPVLGAWCLVSGGITTALYLHNMAVFLAATLAAAAALSLRMEPSHRRGLLKNWAVAGAISALAYLPWFTVFIQQAASSAQLAWGSASVSSVIASIEKLFVMPREAPVGALLTFSLIVVALVASWRHDRVVAWSLFLFMLLPIALALMASAQRSVFSSRTLIGCTPAAHVLVALGATYLAAPLGLGLLALLLLLRVQLLPGHYRERTKEGWREALTYVAEHSKRKTVLLSVGGREKKQIQYYYERRSRPIPRRTLRTATPEDVLRQAADAPSVVAVYLRRRRTIAKPVLTTLESGGWEPGVSRRFQDIALIDYTRRQGPPPTASESPAKAEARPTERPQRKTKGKGKGKGKRDGKRKAKRDAG
jgi:mannosyltransferase